MAIQRENAERITSAMHPDDDPKHKFIYNNLYIYLNSNIVSKNYTINNL